KGNSYRLYHKTASYRVFAIVAIGSFIPGNIISKLLSSLTWIVINRCKYAKTKKTANISLYR
ncbi:MAG: hypothetical protein PHS89_11460, partial [Syntrophaceticus schinkii]|nr:hypothetical protein [Syntrophaceticus schinkii]